MRHSTFAFLSQPAKSELFARCSKSSSIDGKTHAFGNASAKLGINLEEVLDLSLFGCGVTLPEVTSNVIHGALSHAVVEGHVEERAWLLVVSVWMRICISTDWSSEFLLVDSILLVLLWSFILGWFVVSRLAIAASNVHNTITLVVSGTQSCSVRAVDWNLIVVGSKTMPMGISVV